MIIVEGPDNTGKTTLKNRLMKVFPLTDKGHSGGPPKTVQEWEDRMYRLLLDKTRQETLTFIVDRFFYSEIVYGKVLRGSTIVPQRNMDILEDLLMEHDPMIIYCRRPVHRIKETLSERDQLEGVNENIARICREYDTMFGSRILQFRDRMQIFDFEESSSWLMLHMKMLDYLGKKGR
jgi:thymidylate kinase